MTAPQTDAERELGLIDDDDEDLNAEFDRLVAEGKDGTEEPNESLDSIRDLREALKAKAEAEALKDKEFKEAFAKWESEYQPQHRVPEPEGEMELAASELVGQERLKNGELKDRYNPVLVEEMTALLKEANEKRVREVRANQPGFDSEGNPIQVPAPLFDPTDPSVSSEAFNQFLNWMAGRPMQRVPDGYTPTQWRNIIEDARRRNDESRPAESPDFFEARS